MDPRRVSYLFRVMDMNGMRSSKTYYLPDSVDFYSTNNSESLASDLSQSIGEILTEAIKKREAVPVLLFLEEARPSLFLKSFRY